MNTWKENLEETKRHYVDWWNHKGIVLNMWEHFQEGVKPHGPYSKEDPIHLTEAARNNFGTGAFGLPGAPQAKDNNQRWFDAQWRADYLDWYVGHSCLKADMLPVANTQLGPGSLASILGSRVEGGEDTIWIHTNPDFKDKLTFDHGNKEYLIHKELLKACKKKAKGNYYVGMPDLMEGLDILTALKGTDKVLMDTVMNPEMVEEQLKFINDTYFKVFDELYDIIREGDEMAFCYFSLWAPGKMTKLQCDVSTMISPDDYRRFVQPFIREQCQKIPYTLYHLDGVGALQHLPSLLEIEELNAIQWTPGVGEPQGGDPKWYDLYRQILAAGKSIMPCWVTLDQLRPLLDNVGGDGIHLEMDFHNEEEVEKAMEIIKEYQSDDVKKKVDEAIHIGDMTDFEEKIETKRYRPIHVTGKSMLKKEVSGFRSQVSGSESMLEIQRPDLADLIEDRMLILDGAMGTRIQKLDLGEVKSSDYLCIEKPEVIAEIHRSYLAAGADIITTNTFNAQSVSLADAGLADKAYDINVSAVKIARQQADIFTLTNPAKPRYVLGGIGSTRVTISIPDSSSVSREELYSSYKEQAKGLIAGGADGILFETVFDIENLEIGIKATKSAMKDLGKKVPLFLSCNYKTPDGTNMLGQNVVEFFRKLNDRDVLAVGVNCYGDIEEATEILRTLATTTQYYILTYPNAGMPDANGNYPMTPEEYRQRMWPMIEQHLINIVGGCCGTTDEHIAVLSELVEPFRGLRVSPHKPGEEPLPTSGPLPASPRGGADTPREEQVTPESLPREGQGGATPILDAIAAGNQKAAVAATEAAVAAGGDPGTIINTQMIEAMSIVGQKFQEGTAFVPQLLMAGRAMKAALAILKPIMDASGTGMESIGKIVIGTVKGDLHDIGKNLVASMLEGSGFEVINVGIDIDADTFVKALKDNNADILCLSALLTTTMPYMNDVIQAVKEAGLRDKVKIMIGGAPISQEYADEIGADGYSSNANEAVQLAKNLMNM